GVAYDLESLVQRETGTLVDMLQKRAGMTRSGLLVLRLPPAPSSTLFPYTTLFRSRALSSLRQRLPQPEALRDPPRLIRRGELPEDRKSTRLNSSHLGSSYAVFCLKKKTSRPPPHQPHARRGHTLPSPPPTPRTHTQ